jgi:hypothetical protein
MGTDWRRPFGRFLVGWLLAGAGLLAALGLWDVQLYFVIAAVGFLLAVEYSEPLGHRPKGHRRLRWVSLGVLLVFANIVVSWIQNVTGVSLV